MRRPVSHGTNQIANRIYPVHPDYDEAMSRWQADQGLFNDGLDRLTHGLVLSEQEKGIFDALPLESPIRARYRALNNQSHILLRISRDKQDYMRGDIPNPGPYSVRELGHQLIAAARSWTELKEELQP